MNFERIERDTTSNLICNHQQLDLGPVQERHTEAARATNNATALARCEEVTDLSPQRIRRATRQAKRRDRLALGPASEHATEISLALQLVQTKGVQQVDFEPVQGRHTEAVRATNNATALARCEEVTDLSPQRIRRASRQAKRRDRLALGPASEHATEIPLALRLAQTKGVLTGYDNVSGSNPGRVFGSTIVNTNSVDMDTMDASSLSSSSSSLMSEMAEMFPELKTTWDSIEVPGACEIGNSSGIIQDDRNGEDDVFEPESSSYSNTQQMLDKTVIEMLSSKVECQRLTMKDVRTFDKCKRVKNINDLQEIGRGTYGRVLLARHIQTKRLLAIKQSCRSENHQSSNEMVDEHHDATRARVKKEALVHQLLSDSPFFPRFLGTLDIDKDLYLAQEFVGNHKSGIAFPLLEPPPLSVANGLNIAEDVVRGMMEIHDHGLLHNDLKTDNVLLEKRGHRYHAVIIDFGMVSTISSPLRMTELSEALKVAYIHGEEGDYVAPEVILHGQSTSISSDVFSVGKLLEDITQVVEEGSPLLKDLTSIAIKCMKRNPESRPNLSSVLGHLITMKTQLVDRPVPLWKRLVKKHR